MSLKGIFIPQFSTRSNNRVDRVVARKTARKSVLCVSSDSSLYCLKDNEFPHKDHCQNIRNSPISVSSVSAHPELSFVRLQPCGEELPKGQIRPFGRFVAREAVLDEEYWTAAWLRAEAHWESVSYMRSVDMYKRKYAEQEFYDLKRRCTTHDGNSLKCICIVTVKKEDPNVRRTVLNSVVGTLDLSIRQFSQGESFQGELRKGIGILASHAVSESHRYAYISNLCVSKFARRQGIASNMLYLAADIAASSGMKQLFVHVNADNCPAQELYKKNDFQIVEVGSSPLSNNQRLLMCMEFC